MRSTVSADVICVFEHTGTSVDAQQFILARIRDFGIVSRLHINNVRIVRWCDPETNEPRRFEHPDGKLYYRYNAQISVNFQIEGGYAETQQWILDRLNEGEESSYMNVQSIDVSLASAGA